MAMAIRCTLNKYCTILDSVSTFHWHVVDDHWASSGIRVLHALVEREHEWRCAAQAESESGMMARMSSTFKSRSKRLSTGSSSTNEADVRRAQEDIQKGRERRAGFAREGNSREEHGLNSRVF